MCLGIKPYIGTITAVGRKLTIENCTLGPWNQFQTHKFFLLMHLKAEKQHQFFGCYSFVVKNYMLLNPE